MLDGSEVLRLCTRVVDSARCSYSGFYKSSFLHYVPGFLCYSAALTIGYVMQKRNLSYKWVSVL